MLPNRAIFAGFAAHRRGTAAVEFGLIGVFSLWLIVEIAQAGLYFYASASLQNATARAARQIMVGAVSQQGMTAAQFRSNVLCPLLPAVMPCANVITNVQKVSPGTSPNGFYQFVNASQTGIIAPTMDNTKTSFCSGGTGFVIYVQTYYAMPLVSWVWRAVASTSFNGAPAHFIAAATAFQNEPFQSSQSPGC